MKKIYLSLFSIFISVFAVAQCTLAVGFSQNGIDVTVNATGIGALEPAYVIDWGDGTNDFGGQATHTFLDNGNYNVCITYLDQSNPLGCNATECQLFIIGSGGCAIEFSEIISGLFVSIDASGAGGTNPGYSINWGDGTASTASSSGNHTYAASGDYTICVTYSSVECVVETCETFTINSAATCVVDGTFTIVGNTVSITSVGSGAANPQYAISWDNGGAPVLSGEGSFTYPESGTYFVCVIYLDLINTANCNATDCQEIILNVNVDETSIANGGVSVYPNPLNTNSSIQLNLNKPEFTVIELFNLVGDKVSTIAATQRPQGTSQIAWNSSELASGIYFVQVTAGAEKQTIKVIKE